MLNVLTTEVDRTPFLRSPGKDNERQRVDHLNEIQNWPAISSGSRGSSIRNSRTDPPERFADRKPEHFVFPSGRRGISGNTPDVIAYAVDPAKPNQLGEGIMGDVEGST